MSTSPSKPVPEGIDSIIIDRIIMSMGTQGGEASSSARLQPQLTSSSVGLTPVLGSAHDIF